MADDVLGRKIRHRKILGSNCIAVHHIGSTAVSRLKAKPIIDIMPVVLNINEVDIVKAQFEAIGYEYLGEFEFPADVIYAKAVMNVLIKSIFSLLIIKPTFNVIWPYATICQHIPLLPGNTVS